MCRGPQCEGVQSLAEPGRAWQRLRGCGMTVQRVFAQPVIFSEVL